MVRSLTLPCPGRLPGERNLRQHGLVALAAAFASFGGNAFRQFASVLTIVPMATQRVENFNGLETTF